ncbi:MAG TPA: BON domain-containing protein [Gemmatimonadales bacterium]|nr:BON domain-containing protein [Gemmatimonadales bacterium]
MCADYQRREAPHFSPLTPHAREQRDIGRPGGGAGRRDYVGGSGVYPASLGPDRIPRDAEIRTPAAWGQGERGAQGYYDSGRSELFMYGGQLLGGYEDVGRPGGRYGGFGTRPYGYSEPGGYGGEVDRAYRPGYAPPMVYDRENYRYAESHPTPPGETWGRVGWGGGGGGAPLSTRMNPDHLDTRGAMPGRDYSFARTAQGPHYGRGPKGYRRPDDRIAEDVNEALTQHPAIDASDVEVEVHDGVVTLRGTVDDRTAKRLAVDVAESVFGVRDVQSEMRTRHRDDRDRPRDDAESRREERLR